mmetsp:Transcript_57508/g.157919  ORF Transcript_57508/g.157919 Transcript_57508/m.157919 type:complete len:351 (+) Transcript_57508:1845-2897(+)
MADDRRGEAGRRVAPVGVKVEEPILAMLEREVERGEVLEVAARLGGALEQHVEHVGAGACTDEPRRLEQTARLQQHGDRGRVDGRAAVEIQQQEAQRQVELLERRQVRAHLLHDRVGRAEEDHPVQVDDERGRTKLLEHLLLGRRARHLGALEQQRRVLQHARVARVLDDEDHRREEQPQHDGVQHAERGRQRDVHDHQRKLTLGEVGPRLLEIVDKHAEARRDEDGREHRLGHQADDRRPRQEEKRARRDDHRGRDVGARAEVVRDDHAEVRDGWCHHARRRRELREAVVHDLGVVVDIDVKLLLERRVLQQLADDVWHERGDRRQKSLLEGEAEVDVAPLDDGREVED